jgi:hypothetical protein
MVFVIPKAGYVYLRGNPPDQKLQLFRRTDIGRMASFAVVHGIQAVYDHTGTNVSIAQSVDALASQPQGLANVATLRNTVENNNRKRLNAGPQ